jgi:ribose-phosphate pyrophosphokinase
VDHLSAMPVIAEHVNAMSLGECVVVSPDVGNVKQANNYASKLGAELAVVDKRRLAGDITVASRVIGDVRGKTVLMFDDMITTAGTASEAVKILRKNGAKKFLLAATHPVLAGPAVARLQEAQIDYIVVTDTIPLASGVKEKLPQIRTLSVAPLLGEAIRRIHSNQSVSALFQNGMSGPRN